MNLVPTKVDAVGSTPPECIRIIYQVMQETRRFVYLFVVMVSSLREFQPRLALLWVGGAGGTASVTLGLVPRRAVAVA